MNEEELSARFWQSLLAALDACQLTIDLLDALDAGTNNYLAEWEELDGAFAHMHNVKRWVGRARAMGQWPHKGEHANVADTQVFRKRGAS